MSRVEGKMSRVQKCRQYIYYHLLFIFFIITFYNSFYVSKNIDFVYIQALSLLSKNPEFLGLFCIIQQFMFLYTIEYFHAVSSIPKISRFHFLVV